MNRFLQKQIERLVGSGEAKGESTGVRVAVPAAAAQPDGGLARLMASPAMYGNEFIAEGDVDRTRLAEAFNRCFLKVTFDADGDLWLGDAEGQPVLVHVDAERRTICLMAFYRFRAEAATESRMALASRCNSEFRMVRFRLGRDDAFIADYCLSYERGLLASQLVHSARTFSQVAVAAIRHADRDNIVR